MKTVQEITDIANARIDAGLFDDLDTEQKKTDYVNDQIISEMKSFLVSTDWIVVKISEALIKGQDTAALLTKYDEDLTNRASARAAINSVSGG